MVKTYKHTNDDALFLFKDIVANRQNGTLHIEFFDINQKNHRINHGISKLSYLFLFAYIADGYSKAYHFNRIKDFTLKHSIVINLSFDEKFNSVQDIGLLNNDQLELLKTVVSSETEFVKFVFDENCWLIFLAETYPPEFLNIQTKF